MQNTKRFANRVVYYKDMSQKQYKPPRVTPPVAGLAVGGPHYDYLKGRWSKRRETEYPEELKTWQGQLDVINADDTPPSVQHEHAWLRHPPPRQAPGSGQLTVGLARRHGSFGEDGLDFQQHRSRDMTFASPARHGATFHGWPDVQHEKPVRKPPDKLKRRMRQDAEHTRIRRSDDRHLVH